MNYGHSGGDQCGAACRTQCSIFLNNEINPVYYDNTTFLKNAIISDSVKMFVRRDEYNGGHHSRSVVFVSTIMQKLMLNK